jgi:hypothetical protein
LGFLPWDGKSASDEICPCCYIQFGYDDTNGGDESGRDKVYVEWKRVWIEEGMKWNSKGRRPPAEWNPADQLRLIGIQL